MRKNKSSRSFKRKFTIPIFDAEVWIVISRNINVEREKMSDEFGEVDLSDNFTGLCSYNGCGRFALFFDSSKLTIGLIAHEVFHLTHRILDWASCNFDSNHHEQGALLNEFLTKLVWSIVLKNKIKMES